MGRQLIDRGHDVAWAGHADEVGERLPDWATFLSVADTIPEAIPAPDMQLADAGPAVPRHAARPDPSADDATLVDVPAPAAEALPAVDAAATAPDAAPAPPPPPAPDNAEPPT